MMNLHRLLTLLSAAATALVLNSCDSERGEPREVQLEKTATDLEAKAEKIRNDVEETVAAKQQNAETLRNENGNPKAADILEKDATVTKEVGEMRAGQLEKKAQEVRDKKEDASDNTPLGKATKTEEEADIIPEPE